MTVHRFEELEIWKLARLLCVKINDISENTSLAKDFSLKDQISRSSGSVMDNIAEGYERDGTKEFIQFLYIAKGSLGETRSQLYRCLDKKHITELKFTELYNDCINLSVKIKNFTSYLATSGIQGNKKRPPIP